MHTVIVTSFPSADSTGNFFCPSFNFLGHVSAPTAGVLSAKPGTTSQSAQDVALDSMYI